MLNRIPSDVVEIVVVYTKSYDSYIELKEIVEKFNDEELHTRIRDKLTTKHVDMYAVRYSLKNISYRGYDKPYYISRCKNTRDGIYSRINSTFSRNYLPFEIFQSGSRFYINRYIGFTVNLDRTLMRIGRKCFYSDGKRHINNETIDILK